LYSFFYVYVCKSSKHRIENDLTDRNVYEIIGL